MDPTVSEWLNLVFRWIHVLAGVMWIGHLWFFNFVNAQLVKTYDADSKKKVVPELMPRALYFFRWGAAYTWISGLLLFGIVYSMGGLANGAATGAVIGAWIAGFALYDVLWKQIKDEKVGAAVSFVLLGAVALGLSRMVEGRTLFIGIGGLFGTIMAANVWMRIWPNQRKIIAGVKGTAAAPDASVPALAGLRSKHNTYLSMPLILLMVSNHFSTVLGGSFNWAVVLAFTLVGWGIAKFCYTKSGTAAPASF